MGGEPQSDRIQRSEFDAVVRRQAHHEDGIDIFHPQKRFESRRTTMVVVENARVAKSEISFGGYDDRGCRIN